MAVTVDGELPEGVSSKDVILAVIAQIGTNGAAGHVIEYRGSAIEALSMEARMTICNMSIEAGAKAGLIAPDATTFEYLKGRPHAPLGADWDAAVAYWTTLRTDEGAVSSVRATGSATPRHPSCQPPPGPRPKGPAAPPPLPVRPARRPPFPPAVRRMCRP